MAIIPHIESGLLPRNGVGRLLYSNLPTPSRGLNSINPIVYGDRTSGTCDVYRMGHDSLFGGTTMKRRNFIEPRVYKLGFRRQKSPRFHYKRVKNVPFLKLDFS